VSTPSALKKKGALTSAKESGFRSIEVPDQVLVGQVSK
jgi:hypothetical protein